MAAHTPAADIESPRDLHPLTPADWAIAGGILLFWLATYVRTLAPSLLLGDSAEFQTLSYTLGMTHPTGYPVYLLLGKLFTLLPVGSIAYRVSLLSAVSGALALALSYLLVTVLTGRRLAALPGAFLLGAVNIYWSQAVIAELYSPAAAFTAGILLLVLLWRAGHGDRYLFVAGLLGGLSLGVHNTVALTAPAILLYLAVSAPKRQSWSMATAGALIGFSLTLGFFLILDGLDSPSGYYNSVVRPSLSTWDMTAADFDSAFERLRFLATARQFQLFMFSEPISSLLGKALDYITFLRGPYAIAGLALTAIGLVALLVWQWREGVLVWTALLTMLGFLLNYHVYDIAVFFIPAMIVVLAAASSGIAFLMRGVDWLANHVGCLPDRWMPYAARLGAYALLLIVVVQTSPSLLEGWAMGHLPVTEAIDPEYPYPVYQPELPLNLARLVVNHLEDDAIVFTDWDMLYTYYYVAHIEQGRTGIRFHETYPQDGVETVAASALALIDASLETHPVYFTDPPTELRQIYHFRRVQSGVPLYQIQE